MPKLNYDLIPEELKRKAVDLVLINYTSIADWVKIWGDLEGEILATQQTKKPVDMSVLVDSGVLCVFSDSHNLKLKGFLLQISHETYALDNFTTWKYCRPLYGHWHSAKNFGDVEGFIAKLVDAGFCVGTDKCYGVTEHFRIIGLQDGYCYPWESEGE